MNATLTSLHLLQIPDCGLLCDLLWSDPDKDITGWSENDRGVSFTFGPDVVSRFLQKHDMDLICRAHQVVEDGYEFFSKRQLVTLFSAPNYCGEFDNAGAMMSVDESLLCSFQILKPAEKKQKYVVLYFSTKERIILVKKSFMLTVLSLQIRSPLTFSPSLDVPFTHNWGRANNNSQFLRDLIVGLPRPLLLSFGWLLRLAFHDTTCLPLALLRNKPTASLFCRRPFLLFLFLCCLFVFFTCSMLLVCTNFAAVGRCG